MDPVPGVKSDLWNMIGKGVLENSLQGSSSHNGIPVTMHQSGPVGSRDCWSGWFRTAKDQWAVFTIGLDTAFVPGQEVRREGRVCGSEKASRLATGISRQAKVGG